MGSNVAAAIDAPLGEMAAIRLVSCHYHDAGFIDILYPGSPDRSSPMAALGGLSGKDVGVSAFGVPARHGRDADSHNVDDTRGGITFSPLSSLSWLLVRYISALCPMGLQRDA